MAGDTVSVAPSAPSKAAKGGLPRLAALVAAGLAALPPAAQSPPRLDLEDAARIVALAHGPEGQPFALRPGGRLDIAAPRGLTVPHAGSPTLRDLLGAGTWRDRRLALWDSGPRRLEFDLRDHGLAGPRLPATGTPDQPGWDVLALGLRRGVGWELVEDGPLGTQTQPLATRP